MSAKPGDAIAKGTIKAQGRAMALDELLGLMTAPEYWFPIVTRPAWTT